ncbi:MAG: DUF3343 domain-containing protein [Actinobacteria bacterium]|nr:DUF3343 domain-containing protein [Actinomycetota bacterium]
MAGKSEAVLVFPSTHHMLRAEALLKEGGFRVRLVPAPPQAGELCTTAVAVPSQEGRKAASLLEARGVLLKAVLFPEEAAAAIQGRFPVEAAEELAALPGLGGIVEKLTRQEALGRRDIVSLLGLEGEEGRLCRAAEALAGGLAGREAVPAFVLDLRGGAAGGRKAGKRQGKGQARDLERLRALAAEMASLGLAYLILDLGGGEGVPWSAEEFQEALRGEVVAVVHADKLPGHAGELVRGYGVRQVLLGRGGLRRAGPQELTDEILFLRDNRPGPVGSGNLVPLLSRGLEVGEEEGRAVRRVLAVLRLVLGEAFLPVPEALWRRGELCGGNLVILEGVTERLRQALREAEDILSTKGWSVKRVKSGRGGSAATR